MLFVEEKNAQINKLIFMNVIESENWLTNFLRKHEFIR